MTEGPDHSRGAGTDHPLVRVLRSPETARFYAASAAAFRDSGDRRRMANQLVYGALAGRLDERAAQGLHRYRFYDRADYLLFYLDALDRLGIASNNLEAALERYLTRMPSLSDDKRRAALAWLQRPPAPLTGPPPIFVAAMPKSASTYLCNVLNALVGGAVNTPHSQNERTGTALDLLATLRALSAPGVVHSHLPAGARTVAVLALLAIRPIVLVRNIHDAIVSYADHLAGRAYPGSRPSAMTREAGLESALARIAPFYVDFFATWWLYRQHADIKLVHYDELVARPEDTVAACCEWLGLTVERGRIAAAVAANDPRSRSHQGQQAMKFNVGVSGRGRTQLSTDQIARVRLLYDEFPDVDFSMIDPEWQARR